MPSPCICVIAALEGKLNERMAAIYDGFLACSKVLMTDQYAVSLPHAADVSLLSIFSGPKAQLSGMLTGQNKLRNVALDSQSGRSTCTSQTQLIAFCFLSLM